MGSRTKIDWCDASWNPVTGCLHGCPYCYARSIATRFGGCDPGSTYSVFRHDIFHRVNPGTDRELALFEVSRDHPPVKITENPHKVTVAPYPFGFKPTLRLDRMDIPAAWKKPRNVFVCSMADLFGDWVPAEWIMQVFNACRAAPQHRYLFLTKNPKRYGRLMTAGLLPEDPNFWFGATWETDRWSTPAGARILKPLEGAVDWQTEDFAHPEAQYTWRSVPGANVFPDIGNRNAFLSLEPLMCDLMDCVHWLRKSIRWIIVGAETGNRRGRIIPERAWVDHVTENADRNGAKVFMKESLRELMAGDFRQEFPWTAAEQGEQ